MKKQCIIIGYNTTGIHYGNYSSSVHFVAQQDEPFTEAEIEAVVNDPKNSDYEYFEVKTAYIKA